MQNECNCPVVWAFFGTALLRVWNEIWPFPVLWALLTYQICWHIECSTWTASFFKIWNSSAGIVSPPVVLSLVMLPKAHLTSHSRMSGFRWVTIALWLSGSLRPFLYSSSVYSCYLLISSASVRSLLFLSFIMPIFACNIPLHWKNIANFLFFSFFPPIFLKRSLVFPILSFFSIFVLFL